MKRENLAIDEERSENTNAIAARSRKPSAGAVPVDFRSATNASERIAGE